MPRDGSGNFTLPANTQAVSGDPISSTKYNTLVQDLEADANTDRPIVAGGTGASTALAARANLGLEIGTDVQAFDAGLLSIAGLTTVADRSIYTTASDTYAVYTLTAAGRAILDDADASAQRTTLGLGSLATLSTINNDNWSGTDLAVANGGTGASDASTALTNLGALAASAYTASDVLSKLLTVDGAGTGLDADLLDGVQPSAFGLTIIDDADASAARTTLGLANGATTTISAFALTMLDDVDAAAVRTTIGAGIGDMLKSDNLSGLTNYATARTNLGLVIGTDVQAFDQQLQDISALAVTDGGFIVGNGSTFVLETDATARTSLGLGTAAVVNTGTSGATIPRNDTANTFSETQTATRFQVGTFLMDDNIGLGADIPGFNLDSNDWLVYYRASNRLEVGIGAVNAFSVTGSGATILGNTAWHAGNDGAGSGLDADTLDGVEGSAFGQLAGANSWNNVQTINFGFDWRFRNSSSNFTAGSAGASISLFSDGVQYFDNYEAGGFNFRGASFSSLLTLSSTAATFSSPVRARAAASTETTGTLTSASANTTIQLTGDPTINNSVFSAGDIIVMYAGASARTITAGTITTMRLDGTATTGSRTLAARGVAMLFFVSSSEVIVSGGAVT